MSINVYNHADYACEYQWLVNYKPNLVFVNTGFKYWQKY